MMAIEKERPTNGNTPRTQDKYSTILSRLQEDTQLHTLLKHLMTYGSIEPREAFLAYGIYRISSRIYNLRSMGVDIDTMIVSYMDGDQPKHYAKYVLNGE